MTEKIFTLADIANRLNQEYWQDHRNGQGLPALFFVTDQQAIPHPEKIISELSQEAAVIFRDYDHPSRAALCAELARLCRKKNIPFLVAGDIALAEKLGASGVHLPEIMMMQADDIRRDYPHWIITAACHDLNSVRKAGNLPIDAALIAPIFPTHSHAETLTGEQKTLGLRGVQAMVKASSLPLYGLGGISSMNGRELIGSGLVGLAAIRGFK
ncbi:MAG: thiamine phosphate synthase [Emcibacter sp.]|nr:thiamine phosphate synthase [Emcibacter sp.]